MASLLPDFWRSIKSLSLDFLLLLLITFDTTSAFSAAAAILISDNAGLFGDRIKSKFGGRFKRKLDLLLNSAEFLLFVDIL